MKKIVGAVLAGAMLVGSAFAADISFSYTGYNYVKSSGGNIKIEDRSDCMALTLKNDTAGVTLDFDTDSDAKTLVQDQYYGWLDFAIPTGSLEITAGKWAGRNVNRVTTDAEDLDGEDFELYKPGVIGGLFGNDSSNLTLKNIAMVAAYTNAESLPGKFMAKFGLVNSEYNPDATAASTAKESGDVTDSDLLIKAGFVGELFYQQDDAVKVTLAVRNYTKKNLSVGAWVSPLAFENLSLTLGGTFATGNNYDKYNSADGKEKEWANGAKEFGIDLRARYKFSDEFSVTTMHNLSSHANLPSGSDVEKGREYGDNTLVLWDMVSLAYKFDPRLTIGCTLNAVFDNLDSNHVFTGANVTTSPYLRIQATERVAVTTSLRCEVTGWNPKIDGHESLDVTVPVIFAFNY